ncbi:MAG: sulfur carrier protein ThiS [Bacteroidales bacterium]|nr:sulfur carrier protein ThiS [Bacteroidales bacterium]
MKIFVNNREQTTNAANVLELVEELGIPRNGVALAVENKMVPNSMWEETPLTEEIHIIIIKAACGG